MKPQTKLPLTILLSATLAWAQQQEYGFVAPAPQAPTNIRAGVQGNGDTRTYFYWVVAIFPRGSTLPAGPARVGNAPQTLSATNKISISWTASPGASSYAVVRGDTATNPLAGGSCASCLVASGITTTSTTDAGAALSNYTLGSSIPEARATLRLDNTNHTLGPRFRFSPGSYFPWQVVGADTLANRPSTCSSMQDVFVCVGGTCDPDPSVYFCTAPNTWTVISAAGTGDVVGPASATDNALAVFDDTTGKLLRSGACLDNGTGITCGAGTFELHRWDECWTVFDTASDLTTDVDIPTLFAFIGDFGVEVDTVYCETDANTASINLQRDDGSAANVLSASLVCGTGGQSSCASGCDVDTIQDAEDNFAIGNKLDLVTAAIDAGVRRLNVCVSGAKE